jgi:hypothetical protein
MLTGTDGQASGGGGVDTFRIKIWDIADGDAVVYDNLPSEADDSYEGTQLGGGSIVIHSGGKKLTGTEGIGATAGVRLTQSMLDATIAGSIAQWVGAGVSSRRLGTLAGIDFELANFSGSTLGLASSSTNKVWLDADGAGLGWSLGTDSGGYDLLSAVSHEIGHKLGFDHDVMEDSLAPGERHLPSEHLGELLQKTHFARKAAQRDAVFASLRGDKRELDLRQGRSTASSPADVLAAVRARALSRAASLGHDASREHVRPKTADAQSAAHDEVFSSLGEALEAIDLRI